MLLFLILLFFGSRLTPYLCLLKWCFCFNLFFTLFLLKTDYKFMIKIQIHASSSLCLLCCAFRNAAFRI